MRFLAPPELIIVSQRCVTDAVPQKAKQCFKWTESGAYQESRGSNTTRCLAMDLLLECFPHPCRAVVWCGGCDEAGMPWRITLIEPFSTIKVGAQCFLLA